MQYHKAFGHANHCYILKNLDVGDGGWRTLEGLPPNGAIKKIGIDSHLIGLPFVRRGGDTCQVALLDLDDHDGAFGWDAITGAADQLMMACDVEGLHPHPFRSSGGKGVHLWFVWESPQRAAGVRAALGRVLAACGYRHGTGGVIKGEVEIFPKQDQLGANENGNCACLPFRALDFTLSDYDATEYEWTPSAPVAAVVVQELTGSEPGDVSESQLASMLEFVPVEGLGYDEWWQRVMAIKDAGGSKELAEEWSRRDPAYADMTIADAKWSSVRGESGRRVTVRTLMKLASENGWGGIEADVEAFPVAVGSVGGEMLVDYERVTGKGRWSGYKVSNTVQLKRLMSRDPEFPWKIAWDDFQMSRIISCGDGFEVFQDHHYVDFQEWLDIHRWEPVKTNTLREVANNVAKHNRVNTAQAWINGLKWDGVDRYPGLVKAFGAGDNPYYLAVMRYMMTAGAQRILEPGCQADAIVVLISEAQGMRKSSAIQALAPKIGNIDTYQNISIETLLSDDRSARALKGCLIANLDEMRDFLKKEQAEIKSAITKRKESYTPKYMEAREEYGRSCLFYATNNHLEFLNDETGSRRYHPIDIENAIDDKWIAENRDQLWAQGAADYRANGQAWEEAEKLAPEAHKKHVVEDLWDAAVVAYLDTSPEEYFTATDILTHSIGVPLERQNESAKKRVGRILSRLGYKSKPHWVNGKTGRYYHISRD